MNKKYKLTIIGRKQTSATDVVKIYEEQTIEFITKLLRGEVCYKTLKEQYKKNYKRY